MSEVFFELFFFPFFLSFFLSSSSLKFSAFLSHSSSSSPSSSPIRPHHQTTTRSWFSNGIELSDAATNLAGGAEDQIIMCETFSARLAKVALTGAAAGKIEPFAPSLPGYCDGVFGVPKTPASAAAGTVGTYYVSINSKQAAAGAKAIAASPQLRWALARAPQQGVELIAPPYGLVVRVDSQGKIAQSLQDPSGQVVARASSAVLSPDGTKLFMGSVTAAGLPFVKVA